MIEQVLQVVAVIAASFAVLAVLTSFFRFENRVAAARAADPAKPAGEDAWRYLVAGCLATGPQIPAPCILFRVDLDARDVFPRLGEEARRTLAARMAEGIRGAVRGRDLLLCIEPGRYGVVVAAEPAHADGIARRITTAFADEVIEAGAEKVPLQVRVGAAALPQDGTEIEPLLAAAEAALAAAAPGAWATASPPPLTAMPAPEGDAIDPLADVTPAERDVVDPKTGVLGEDHLGGTMQRFVSRAVSRHRHASILCVTIEQFARYAEHYGPEGADRLLAHLAVFLKKAVREEDLIARYGKGTFVILLGCAPEQARRIAERLAEGVRSRPLSIQGAPLTYRLCAGIAACPADGSVASEVFKLALRALGAAEANGGGACLLYGPDVEAHQPGRALQDAF